jgi:hypothetical protein
MRAPRLIALLASGTMTLLIAGALPGADAAVTVEAPTAPFDAFTINGTAGSGLLGSGGYSFDSSNATVVGSYAGPPRVQMAVNSTNHHWSALVKPPTGATRFTLETVYPTLRFADASHAGLDVFGDGRGCNNASGWLVVHEQTEDPITHALTSFAATYSLTCEGFMPAVTGELRWHSSVDYRSVVTNPFSLAFGNVPFNHDSSQTLTITGKGSQPVTLGAASLSGPGAGTFVITSDGCDGAILAYDETCTVVVTAHPTDFSTSQANLVVPDDTVATHRVVPVSVTGVSPVNATITPNSANFGAVALGHPSAPQTVTVTSTGVDPLVFGQTTLGSGTAAAFGITDDTCANTSVAPGQSCTVTVIAHPTALGTQVARVLFSSPSIALFVPLRVTGINPTSATANPTSLSFGTIQLEQISPPQTVTVTSTGVDPITFGTTTIEGGASQSFAVTADTCTGATLANGETCMVSVTAAPQQQGLQQAVLTVPFTGSQPVTVPLSVTGGPDPIGTYYPVPPARIMDTRTGLGAPKAPIGPGRVVHLQVAGQGGVPASGASAVVLNVTVTGPTTTSFLTTYPTGVTRPGASSLNFVKGWTGANSVTVSLGTDGKVDIYNSKGSVQVIVDVAGYYGGSRSLLAGPGMGGEYQPALVHRMVDTRSWGFGPVPAGYSIMLPVDFGSDINAHIRALAVNVTAVSPVNGGYLTAWNGADALPGSSTLNFPAGANAVPNLAIVPVAPCTASPSCAGLPQIGVYNGSAGPTHVLVDIFGIFDDGALGFGLRFQPVAPTRIVDSRLNLGIIGGLGPATERSIHAPFPLARENTVVLALNVTAVSPTANTYLTVWPTGSRPTVSNLNPAKGQTVPNAVLGELDISNNFRVYNNSGSMHLVVDVVGTFVFGPDFFAGIAAGGGPAVQPRPASRRPNVQVNLSTTHLDQPWLAPG